MLCVLTCHMSCLSNALWQSKSVFRYCWGHFIKSYTTNRLHNIQPGYGSWLYWQVSKISHDVTGHKRFSEIFFKNHQHFNFSLYRAPWKSINDKPSFPGFFQGRLFVNGYPSDTFMKLPVSLMNLDKIWTLKYGQKLCIDYHIPIQGWSKGVVFVNGQNIGRYWDAGPQQALFLPGPFLNSGMNQVS